MNTNFRPGITHLSLASSLVIIKGDKVTRQIDMVVIDRKSWLIEYPTVLPPASSNVRKYKVSQELCPYIGVIHS